MKYSRSKLDFGWLNEFFKSIRNFYIEAKLLFANFSENTAKSSSKSAKRKTETSLELAKFRLGLEFDLRPDVIKRF